MLGILFAANILIENCGHKKQMERKTSIKVINGYIAKYDLHSTTEFCHIISKVLNTSHYEFVPILKHTIG